MSLPSGNQQMEQDRTPVVFVISLNWRGEPLINYETIINLIGGTKTRTGLKVRQCWTRTSMRPESKCPTSSATRFSSDATNFIQRGTTRSRPGVIQPLLFLNDP